MVSKAIEKILITFLQLPKNADCIVFVMHMKIVNSNLKQEQLSLILITLVG